MNLPNRLIEEAVEQFALLPGIGKRSALRMVLELMRWDKAKVENFGTTFIEFIRELRFCKECHNVADADVCSICASPKRSNELLCIVEDIRGVIAIENTQQFSGKYHVLGGLIAPMEGIGPAHLTIESLVERVKTQQIKEVILALSATMEGDTTGFYISRKLKEFGVQLSTISRGISVGDELEYADEVTLGRSILNRIPFQQ